MLLLRAPSPDPTGLASRSHGHFLLPIFPACSMPWVNGLTNLARVSVWLPLLNSCNHPLLALSLPSQTAPPASPSCLEHTLLSLCATFEHCSLSPWNTHCRVLTWPTSSNRKPSSLCSVCNQSSLLGLSCGWLYYAVSYVYLVSFSIRLLASQQQLLYFQFPGPCYPARGLA